MIGLVTRHILLVSAHVDLSKILKKGEMVKCLFASFVELNNSEFRGQTN